MKLTIKSASALAVCGIAASAASVHAGFSTILFSIEATSAQGTAIFQVDAGAASMDTNGNFSWNSTAQVELRDAASNNLVAIIDSASFALIDDPVADVTFSVFSGASDTTFTIMSGLVSFPTLVNPFGSASATASVTDTNGDGASLTGLYTGGAAFTAQYNGGIVAGTTFADLLLSPITAGSFGSGSDSANFPLPFGTATVLGSVTDMQVGFEFSLSAFDLASGNGVFEIIVPTPASGMLLIGGLVAIRRRR